MKLADWIAILATALVAVAFFCSRATRPGTFTDRARHARGTRLLVQGALALWTALLTLERSFSSPGGVPFGLPLAAHVVLAAALLLGAAGCLWLIRGRRLLKRCRLFAPADV